MIHTYKLKGFGAGSMIISGLFVVGLVANLSLQYYTQHLNVKPDPIQQGYNVVKTQSPYVVHWAKQNISTIKEFPNGQFVYTSAISDIPSVFNDSVLFWVKADDEKIQYVIGINSVEGILKNIPFINTNYDIRLDKKITLTENDTFSNAVQSDLSTPPLLHSIYFAYNAYQQAINVQSSNYDFWMDIHQYLND